MIERLTQRCEDGSVDVNMATVMGRLADYEDTGLTPEGVFALQTHPDHAYADYVKNMWDGIGGMERMEIIAKAEREGRLCILPPASSQDKKNVFDLYHDARADWIQDLSVGLYGPNEEEVALMEAIEAALEQKG